MLNETNRILPVDELDIKGVQNWLEEMALQGLYLDDTIGTWWHFIGGEPKTVRYRIDPNVKKRGKIEPEKKEDYEEMGWHYVVTFHEYHIFMADDPEVEELHTDSRVESIALKKLEKGLWVDFLQMLLIAAVPYLVSSFQRDELINAIKYPVSFWTGENVAIIFAYPFLLIYFIKIGVSLKKMRDLRKVLSEGVDCENSKDGYKIGRIRKVWNFFYGGLRGLLLLLCFAMFFSCQSVQDFDSPDTPREILSLEKLESGNVITDAEDSTEYLGGWIDDRWNPLLEDNYQIFQRCIVEVRVENSQIENSQIENSQIENSQLENSQPENGKPKSVTLEAEYYKLRIPGMAETLYEEMMEKNIRTSPYPYEITSVENTELDACVVGSVVDKQILVGIKGKEVIYVEYDGDESMVKNAPKIEKLMLDGSLVRP